MEFAKNIKISTNIFFMFLLILFYLILKHYKYNTTKIVFSQSKNKQKK